VFVLIHDFAELQGNNSPWCNNEVQMWSTKHSWKYL